MIETILFLTATLIGVGCVIYLFIDFLSLFLWRGAFSSIALMLGFFHLVPFPLRRFYICMREKQC